MQIKSLTLKNIRSFTDEVINFPAGTMLLAGNIGVGKSTILLAIEFALFGITKELPGAALLRNGADRGSVELTFNAAGKEITIKRALKRGSSVTQDAGHIVIDNATKEATATELKQNILSLLNYPQELLTKSKSLVYRYTVYTPQEEMKNILLGNKEERLDTLRRVFGIDKYKIIKENAELFIAKIKTKNREFAISIADLEVQKDEVRTLEEKNTELKTNLENVTPQLEKAREAILENKADLEALERKIKELQELKKESEVCDAQVQHKAEENKRYKERIEQAESNIRTLEEEIRKEETKPVNPEEIIQKQSNITKNEEERRNLANKAQELKTSQKHAEQIIADIAKLEVCPICKQQVSEVHTTKVRTEEEKKITAYVNEARGIIEEERKRDERIKQLQEEIDLLKKEQEKERLVQIKKDTLAEKKKELTESQKLIAEIKKEIGTLNTRRAEVVAKLADTEETEKKYTERKGKMERLQQQERDWEIKKVTVEKEIENNTSNLKKLQEAILVKTKVKEKINYLKQLQDWLEKQFINITLTMEKKVMLKVHSDFNALFQKWFEMLIDTERMKVKIDEEFSPAIEQNGHTIDYSFLSGGEKTAAALAYRLALNQVINTIVSTIKTKDLLILDEPTDGFSAEQLDRLRGVLEELDAKQIIVVSHENKVESFVENVVKLEKKEHVSFVSDT